MIPANNCTKYFDKNKCFVCGAKTNSDSVNSYIRFCSTATMLHESHFIIYTDQVNIVIGDFSIWFYNSFLDLYLKNQGPTHSFEFCKDWLIDFNTLKRKIENIMLLL